MKKVLFVRTVPYEFNANTYNVQGFGLGKAFCRLGYDFDFLYFSKKGNSEYILYEEDGHKLRVISKPRIRLFRTGICMEICNRDFLKQYDFVLSCEYGQYMTYALSKASDNVVMYSGPYYNMFYLPFMSLVYDLLFTNRINRNIKFKFVKSVLAKEYLENKGYTGVHVVGVGLDLERFDSNVEISEEVRKLSDYMERNECVLYVGALSERKNLPFLLNVYRLLHRKHPNIKFVMIGKGEEKYVKKNFKVLSDEELQNIYRLDRIDNSQLKYIYPKAKAFLLPSKQEIFGMVLLEAMYLRAPVVTSRNGGSLTLINDGSTGQIVNDFNEEEWVNAIEKYINDFQYRNSVVNRAHELVKNKYNWNAIAKSMLNIMKMDETRT